MAKKNLKVTLFILVLVSLALFILYHTFSQKNVNKINPNVNLSTSFYGNYLAGYYATKAVDFKQAAQSFALALYDWSKQDAVYEEVLSNSYIAYVLAGEVDKAMQIAKSEDEASHSDQKNDARLILLAFNHIKNNNLPQALELLQAAMNQEQHLLDKTMMTLMMSWCYAGEGNYKQALDGIKALESSYGKNEIIMWQEALIADMAGNTELAKQQYDQLVKLPISYNLARIAGNFYERHQEIAQAKNLYENYVKENVATELLKKDISRLAAGKTETKPLISNVKQGIAFLLTTISGVLISDKIYMQALFQANLALYLVPDYTQADMVIASFYSEIGYPEQALAYYKKIGASDDFYLYAETNIARNLYKIGQVAAAKHKLQELAKQHPDNIDIILALVEILSDEKHYTEINDIYNRLIDNLKTLKKQDWFLFFLRGSNYGLMKNLPKAALDLEKALSLNPEQYSIMNDLGYTWLEERKNLDKAALMIKTALAKDPDSPQVVDSMGWVLFMQGKYTEAADYLEKAIEMLPYDATISDHLGDVYWKLGYKIEARYEWQHALVNCEDQEKQAILKQKLENGI